MPTKKNEPSTLTQTTKTTWKGRYTCQLHTSQYLLSRSNLRRSSPLPTYTQIGKKQKNKGCWLGKLTQKVTPRIKCPLFGLQHYPTCSLSTPPLPPPCLHTVCTAVAVHIVPRTRHQQPAAGNFQRQRREARSFFCPQTTRSYDLSHYNR